MTKLFGYKRTLTLLAFAGLGFVEANESDPLAPDEADAIIAQREAAKAERKAARIAELEKAEVLSQGEGTLPDGRKVILREVAPPVGDSFLTGVDSVKPVAKPEPARMKTEPEWTADQMAWIAAQEKLQSHKVQMLSCTVYDRNITRIRWTYEDERYLAHTNADFNYLRGVMSVDTKTDRYDYFMGIGNATSDQAREPLPDLPIFSPDRAEYVLVEGDPSNTSATAGLEALLAHYDANLDSLKIAYQRNEALSEARKRYKAAHPEEPENFILQFWVPEKKRTK